MIENIDDILEELAYVVGWAMESDITGKSFLGTHTCLEPDYENLLGNMVFDAISIDELVKSSGLTAGVVSSMLLMMELKELVEPRLGGRYSRRA